MLYISKMVKASAKMCNFLIELVILHRMTLLRMLCSITLIFILRENALHLQ